MRERLGWLFAALLVVALVGSALVPDLLPARRFAPSAPALAADTPPAPAAPGSVRAVVERVRPAVVQITDRKSVV